MKISVLVPCHDPDPAQLEQALQSVRRQGHDDVELVLADDKSGPWHAVHLAPLAKKYDAILIRNHGLEEWGGVGTHNHLLALASGDLLHILHPDDWVLEGFYQNMLYAAERFADVGLFASHHLIADCMGLAFCAGRPDWVESGRWAQPLHEGNPLAVAACVVRREAYRACGGWDHRLVHCGDWEWWIRIAERCGAGSIDWPLAVYRMSEANHTSRLARTAENLKDYLRLAELIEPRCPHLVDRRTLGRYVGMRARNQAEAFRKFGDAAAAAANDRLAREAEGED